MSTAEAHAHEHADDGAVHVHIASPGSTRRSSPRSSCLTIATVKVSYYDFGSANIDHRDAHRDDEGVARRRVLHAPAARQAVQHARPSSRRSSSSRSSSCSRTTTSGTAAKVEPELRRRRVPPRPGRLRPGVRPRRPPRRTRSRKRRRQGAAAPRATRPRRRSTEGDRRALAAGRSRARSFVARVARRGHRLSSQARAGRRPAPELGYPACGDAGADEHGSARWRQGTCAPGPLDRSRTSSSDSSSIARRRAAIRSYSRAAGVAARHQRRRGPLRREPDAHLGVEANDHRRLARGPTATPTSAATRCAPATYSSSAETAEGRTTLERLLPGGRMTAPEGARVGAVVRRAEGSITAWLKRAKLPVGGRTQELVLDFRRDGRIAGGRPRSSGSRTSSSSRLRHARCASTPSSDARRSLPTSPMTWSSATSPGMRPSRTRGDARAPAAADLRRGRPRPYARDARPTARVEGEAWAHARGPVRRPGRPDAQLRGPEPGQRREPHPRRAGVQPAGAARSRASRRCASSAASASRRPCCRRTDRPSLADAAQPRVHRQRRAGARGRRRRGTDSISASARARRPCGPPTPRPSLHRATRTTVACT